MYANNMLMKYIKYMVDVHSYSLITKINYCLFFSFF